MAQGTRPEEALDLRNCSTGGLALALFCGRGDAKALLDAVAGATATSQA